MIEFQDSSIRMENGFIMHGDYQANYDVWTSCTVFLIKSNEQHLVFDIPNPDDPHTMKINIDTAENSFEFEVLFDIKSVTEANRILLEHR